MQKEMSLKEERRLMKKAHEMQSRQAKKDREEAEKKLGRKLCEIHPQVKTSGSLSPEPID